MKTPIGKTIINGIRRTLLTNIDTVAFNPEDIIINTNNSALHNEFMKHRISLMPLYIEPKNYNKDLLFVLKVKNIDNPVQSIYSSDFEIYPLKDNLEDVNLNILDINNYDLKKALSKDEKKKIIRPFIYKEREYYNQHYRGIAREIIQSDRQLSWSRFSDICPATCSNSLSNPNCL